MTPSVRCAGAERYEALPGPWGLAWLQRAQRIVCGAARSHADHTSSDTPRLTRFVELQWDARYEQLRSHGDLVDALALPTIRADG